MSDEFETNQMQANYDTDSALVSPYAITDISGYSLLKNSSDVYRVIDMLIDHVEDKARRR
jgi:spore coat protein H